MRHPLSPIISPGHPEGGESRSKKSFHVSHGVTVVGDALAQGLLLVGSLGRMGWQSVSPLTVVKVQANETA